jgi:hypothetical protein
MVSQGNAIDLLIARTEIRDRLHDYCRAMDRNDRPLAKSVWNSGATTDYRGFVQGPAPEVMDHMIDVHETLISTSHQIANMTIRIDGGRAASETYVLAFLQFEQDGAVHLTEVRGRYLDRWSRRDARWGIDQRLCLIDIGETRRIETVLSPPLGRRDRQDPSYALFADFD